MTYTLVSVSESSRFIRFSAVATPSHLPLFAYLTNPPEAFQPLKRLQTSHTSLCSPLSSPSSEVPQLCTQHRTEASAPCCPLHPSGYGGLEGRRHIPVPFPSLLRFHPETAFPGTSYTFSCFHKPSQGNLVIRPIGFKYPFKIVHLLMLPFHI